MEDLSTDRMLELADVIVSLEPVSVTLTGGEPLLRTDLETIAARLSGRGILTGVATNGLLLDGGRVDGLVEAGIGWFELSIASPDSGKYRMLTGTDGLSRVRSAMLEVKGHGGRLTASHLITSLNYRDAGTAVDLAYGLGAESLALNRFVPGGAGNRRPDLLPTGRQLEKALRLASLRSLESPGIRVYASIPIESCRHPHGDFPGIDFGTCICGSGKWAVSPAGDLRICEQSPGILGNLLSDEFDELIDCSGVRNFRCSFLTSECIGCSSYEHCGGGCRFLHRSESGNRYTEAESP